MADKEEQKPQGSKFVENVGKAASAVKSVATAAAKAGAGDVVGAAVEVLKNPQLRNAIIAIILLPALLLFGVAMMVGCAIVGTIEKFQAAVDEELGKQMLDQAIDSDGNYLYYYCIGSSVAVTDTFVNLIKSAFTSEEEEAIKDNDDLATDDPEALEEYKTIIRATSDMEALTSENGAIQRRIDAIKARVKQREEQLLENVAGQYDYETIGMSIGEAVSARLDDPILYSGIDFDNCSAEIDTSVFELSDIQALKIYAAYSTQHDVVLSDSSMWDLIYYCGWYSTEFRDLDTAAYKDPENPSIYNTSIEGSFASDIGDVISAGDTLASGEYALSPPSVPYWSGTCAPQWYYEEIAQLQAMNKEYDRVKEAAEKEAKDSNATEKPNTEALANMIHFESGEYDRINPENFEKLGSTECFGIIDKIYTSANTTVTIDRTEYHGVLEVPKEWLAQASASVRSLWDEAYGNQNKTTGAGNHVFRDGENSHWFTITGTTSGNSYYLRNNVSGTTTSTQTGNGGELTFTGLWADTAYTVYTISDTGDAAIIDEFETFSASENVQAYELAIKLNVRFSARSVDSILLDILGLWPGSLSETDIGPDGVEYAAGHTGNENLRKTWTDVYTDPDTGEKTVITFERQQGYQVETYEDMVTGVATSLGYDISGLVNPNYGYGGTIVSMAQQELAYYQANGLTGGSRYWEIDGEAELGNKYGYDASQPWCVAFINACAYQCGFIGPNGWFADGAWSYCVAGLWNALVGEGLATGYMSGNYLPVPGDLILFGSAVGCEEPDHIGIVEYVDSDGRVHTIEGNSGNAVKRCTYDSYQLGTFAQENMVISHYINPHYPSAFLDNPVYQAIELGIAPAITARTVDADGELIVFGLPRFRYEQMPEVLDELATMYPELYMEALRNAYPYNLGICRVNGVTWLVPCAYTNLGDSVMIRDVNPATGELNTPHNGLDMGAPEGTPIFAPRDGYVSAASYNNSMGYYVKLAHDGGYSTVYMHMVQKASVSAGDTVSAGQIIGYVGSTGDSTGPHLHYEVHLDGSVQDPLNYIGVRDSDFDANGPVNTAALIDAWNELANSGKGNRFAEAQMNIAAKLYVQPVAQKVTVNTGFNWTSTRLREEILWGIATTSSNQAALVSIMSTLASGLDKRISDAELVAKMVENDFLVATVTASKNNLWPQDTSQIQDKWINGIQMLMIKLMNTYRQTTETEPVTVPTGG